jgi:hypothetical protein
MFRREGTIKLRKFSFEACKILFDNEENNFKKCLKKIDFTRISVILIFAPLAEVAQLVRAQDS